MPVPATVKATLFFECRSHGWTESFHWQVMSNDLSPQAASLQIIAQKRAALLGKEGMIKAERVSFETDMDGKPVVGDSFLQYALYAGAQVPTSDDTDTAVLLTWRNLVGARKRNQFLRGIWDDVNSQGGFYLPSVEGWTSALNSYVAAMLGRAAGWMSSTRAFEYPVTGYTCDQDTGYVKVTLAAGSQSIAKDTLATVRIRGVNGTSPINGQQLIRGISPTEFWLEKPLALIAWDYGGTVIF